VRRLSAAFVIVVLAALLLLWRRLEPGKQAAALETSSAQAAEDPRQDPKPVALPSQRAPSPVEPSNRTCAGFVRTVDGAPISGAVVRWIALRKEDGEYCPIWRTTDWGWQERASVRTTTKADGAFEFADSPEGAETHGSVLIALHPRFLGDGLDLAREGSLLDMDIRLSPSEPVVVEVVDDRGVAVSSARIRHVACTVQPGSADEFASTTFKRFLSDEGRTDERGRVELAAFEGEQVFWAEDEGRVSQPWQGERPRTVTLTLGEGFTIGGSVSLPEWNPTYTGERRILVSGLSGNLWRPLARVRGVQAGEWGPVRVPLARMTRYRVRIEGLPIIPRTVEFPPLAAGAHRRIDFVAEKGAELWFHARDEQQNPLPTAQASVTWADASAPGGRGHVEFGALADGRIDTWGFPAGRVAYRVTAPGFAAYENEEDVPIEDALLITLSRGGKIVGRCVHEGTPVRDFEVLYRLEGPVRIQRSATFLGREDGRFEIDSLGPGSWHVFATSPSFPASRSRAVKVVAGEDAEVELELPAPIRGIGRVIDAQSGEPVPRARVQVFSSGGLERALAWGDAAPVAADGTFDLDAFVLGRNFLTVSAEGYAARNVEENALSSEVLDWGDVPLFRPQVLKVALRGLDELQGMSAGDLRVFGVGAENLPEKRFDREGRASFDSVPPGSLQLIVMEPDGSWMRQHLELQAGQDWNVEASVAGARTLDVLVLDEKEKPPPYTPGILVAAQEENGILALRHRLAPDGAASFAGIRASRVEVNVIDLAGQFVVTRPVDFDAELHASVTIHLGGEPLRIHVVDPEGVPIAGAWVRTRSSSGEDILGVDDTDSSGWASQIGLPPGMLLLDIEHGSAGKRLGIPIEASAKEIEVVLQARGAIELVLVDGEAPLANVSAQIETSGGVRLGDTKITGAAGEVAFPQLGEGSYHIACRRADCWPVRVDEDLAPDETARREVQMRRLAELEITVLEETGLPVSGVELELESNEFDVQVASWIAAGSVRAPAGLVSDAHGKIRLEGLPRGPYSWSLTLGDRGQSGTLEITPGETNEESILWTGK